MARHRRVLLGGLGSSQSPCRGEPVAGYFPALLLLLLPLPPAAGAQLFLDGQLVARLPSLPWIVCRILVGLGHHALPQGSEATFASDTTCPTDFFLPLAFDLLLDNTPISRSGTGMVAAFPLALFVWVAVEQFPVPRTVRKLHPENAHECREAE